MSLQQRCLPVVSNHRKQKKKRKHCNNEDQEEASSSSEAAPVVLAGCDLNFTTLASMDAGDYLAAVVHQANTLPEYFVADDDTDLLPLLPNATTSSQQRSLQPQHHKKRQHPSFDCSNQHEQQRQQQQQPHHSHKTKTTRLNTYQEPAIDGSAASMQYLMSHRTCLLPPPSEMHIPQNPSWVDQTLADFSELRLYLEKCRLEGVGGKKTQRVPLPPMKDRSGWHVFCVGQAEAKGNVGAYFDHDDNDDDDDKEASDDNDEGQGGEDYSDHQHVDQEGKSPNEGAAETIQPTASWRDHYLPVTGHEPTVHLVLQMDQVLVRRVLAHLVFYVEEGWSPCSPQRAMWLYALLARLERPIHRDDAAMLYSLLKILTQVRSKMEVEKHHSAYSNTFAPNRSNRPNLARLNLLIIIIGIYLEQGNASVLV